MSRKRKRLSAKEARMEKRREKAEKRANDVLQELVKPPTDQKKRIDAQRILTQEDFERIRKLKAKFEEARRDPRKMKKGKVVLKGKKGEEDDDDLLDDDDDDAADGRGSNLAIVDPEDLEGIVKRRRASKEERLMKIIGGKSTFEHTGHAGGLTNLEKKRKKNYMMVRKGKRSVFSKLRDTQTERKQRKVKGVKSKFKREARKRRRT